VTSPHKIVLVRPQRAGMTNAVGSGLPCILAPQISGERRHLVRVPALGCGAPLVLDSDLLGRSPPKVPSRAIRVPRQVHRCPVQDFLLLGCWSTLPPSRIGRESGMPTLFTVQPLGRVPALRGVHPLPPVTRPRGRDAAKMLTRRLGARHAMPVAITLTVEFGVLRTDFAVPELVVVRAHCTSPNLLPSFYHTRLFRAATERGVRRGLLGRTVADCPAMHGWRAAWDAPRTTVIRMAGADRQRRLYTCQACRCWAV